jgi:hypothetical protein
MLTSLKKNHARLFLDDSKLVALKKQIEKDRALSELYLNIKKQADNLLDAAPTPFQITGPRMLKNCQQILSRVVTLALLFRHTRKESYKNRALLELQAAADFPHWNPDHFLDTAELCTAFGIAYDWLHADLSSDERLMIRTALLEKGLKVGLEAYESGIWWLDHKFNWNNVCHGGLSIGALAIADEEPDIAQAILQTAVEKLPISLANYGPDGAWQAGTDYWEYTTWYTALFIDALHTALGSDFDLGQTPGLDKTGFFPIYAESTTGSYYNFADAAIESTAKPCLFWLGRQFNEPHFIHANHRLVDRQLKNGDAVHPFHLVWYEKDVLPESALPASAYFRGTEAVFMRRSWENTDGLFVGFKGGLNQADHGHLDLGSFVLDAQSERWALDLGRDDYDLPGYFDKTEGGGRWHIFRLNNKSHNTLTLNDDLQRATAVAPVLKTHFSKDNQFAIVDLTSAYKPHAKKVLRGIALQDDDTVIMQDEIEWAADQKHVSWQLLTDAELEISKDGTKAVLHKNGKQMTARILSPVGATFDIKSAAQMPPENPNEGLLQLVIEHDETDELSVLCIAIGSHFVEASNIKPLADW